MLCGGRKLFEKRSAVPTALLAHINIKIHTHAPDFVMRLGAFVCIPPHPYPSKTFKLGVFFIFYIVRSTDALIKPLCVILSETK